MLLLNKYKKLTPKIIENMKKLLFCVLASIILYSCSKDDDSAAQIPEEINIDFVYTNQETVIDQQVLVYDADNDNEYIGTFSKETFDLNSGQYKLIAVGSANNQLVNSEDYNTVKVLQSIDGNSKLFTSSKMVQVPDVNKISFEMQQANGGIQIVSTDETEVTLDSVRVSVESLYDSYQLHNSLPRGNYEIIVQNTFIANEGIDFDETIYVMPGDADVTLDYYVDGEIVSRKDLGKVKVVAGENVVKEVLFADNIIETVEIPDNVFLSALENVLPAEAFSAGKLIPEHESVKNLKELNIKNIGIENLSGIELFTGLEKLVIESNRVGTLDLSTLVNLKELNCSWCNLTELNLSGCTLLETLNCVSNKLPELDLTQCTQLQRLDCGIQWELTTIDISICKTLTYLDVRGTNLNELNLSGLDLLETVYCNTNFQMTSLNLTGCTSLKFLNCKDAGVTSLDASDCAMLEFLDCQYNNKLEELKISEQAPNLKEIHAQGRPLYTDIIGLSATAQPSLDKLYFGESALCGGNIKNFFLNGAWTEMKWGVSDPNTLTDYTSESCQ